MDTKMLRNCPSYSLPYQKHKHHRKFISLRPPTSLRPSNQIVAEVSEMSKTLYRDSWLELMAINYLSGNLQAVAGIEVKQDGYDGLVEACKVVTTKFDAVQQRQLCLEGLKRGMPTQVFPLLKALVPNTKFVREILAIFTTMFFVWLVGPAEVKESKFNGRTENNVVYIKKCRFLESSNCVGMCTNLCKFPSQTFIKDSLGVPITMNPNFEDMSCEMIFGKEPPIPEDDLVTKQPCYKLCKIRKRHTTSMQCS